MELERVLCLDRNLGLAMPRAESFEAPSASIKTSLVSADAASS